MKVKFFGGPYDKAFKSVPVDEGGRPLSHFEAYESPLASNSPSSKDISVKIVRYELKEFWDNGRFSHYEYHL